jgi:hypothetical protein
MSYLWYWFFSKSTVVDNTIRDEYSTDSLGFKDLTNPIKNIQDENNITLTSLQINEHKLSDVHPNEIKKQEKMIKPAAGRNNPYVEAVKIPKCMIVVDVREIKEVISTLNHIEIAPRPTEFKKSPLLTEFKKYYAEKYGDQY